MSDQQAFITVTKGMRGFFAVMVWWNPQGFWEPYESHPCSHEEGAGAQADAKSWAEAEGLPLQL